MTAETFVAIVVARAARGRLTVTKAMLKEAKAIVEKAGAEDSHIREGV